MAAAPSRALAGRSVRGCTANAGTVQSQRGRGAAEARFRLDLVKLDFGCRFGRQLELSRYDK